MAQSTYLLLLQLGLASRSLAAPVADESVSTAGWDTTKSYGTGGGILGFIVLVLDVIVWIEVLKSNRPASHQLLWCVLVFILPIIGPILYYLFSDRAKWNSGGYEVIPS